MRFLTAVLRNVSVLLILGPVLGEPRVPEHAYWANTVAKQCQNSAKQRQIPAHRPIPRPAISPQRRVTSKRPKNNVLIPVHLRTGLEGHSGGRTPFWP